MGKRSELARAIDAIDAEIHTLQLARAALVKVQGTPAPKKRSAAKARPAETRGAE